MSESSDRHVEVIYCDDIREEVGGKVSYMGIYQGDMYIPSLPTLLPKLCIAVNIVTSISNPFRKLSVKVEKGMEGEELLSTGDMDLSNLTTPRKDENEDPGNENAFLIMRMAFVLSPFQVEKPTILRILVETEHGTIRGRALRIKTQNTPDIEHTN